MRALSFLHRLPFAASRHPRQVLAVCLVVMIAAAWSASVLEIDSDMLSLLPRSSPAVTAFVETSARFGVADTVVLLVRLRPEHTLDAVEEYAEELADGLKSSGLVSWAEYRATPASRLATLFARHALLYLEPAELDRVLASLDSEGLARIAADVHARVLSPHGTAAKELVTTDILGLLPSVFARFDPLARELAGFGNEGLLLDSQREVLLLLARPTHPATDLAAARQLVEVIGAARERASVGWTEAGHDGPPPEVEVGGGPIASVEDGDAIRSDLGRGAIVSLVGVTLVLALALRSGRLVIVAVAPVFLGILCTVAVAALVWGRITGLAASFAALLLGLGVDFGIAMVCRFRAERLAGSRVACAVAAVARHVTPPVFVTACTTGAAFAVFAVTGFPGIVQLGVLTGVGILLVALSALALVPATLRSWPPPLTRRQSEDDRLAARVTAAAERHPERVLGVAAVVLLASIAALGWLRFDEDFQRLRNPETTSARVQREIASRFGARLAAVVLRVDGRTEDEAIARTQGLLAELKRLQRTGEVARIETIAAWLPPVHEQRRTLARLAEAPVSPAKVATEMEQALRHAGLAVDAFAEGIAGLQEALSARSPIRPSIFAGGELALLIERGIAVRADGASLAVYCFPGAGQRAVPPGLRALAERTPHVVLTGPLVLSEELRTLVRREGSLGAVLGLGVVVVLLGADLRSRRDTLLALTPLACGVLLMLGGLSVLGVPIDLVNAFAFTMVSGIGVDYGIHLVHRFREGERARPGPAASAILTAAATTMVGFGSFAVSSYPGFRGLGIAVMLGVGGCCLSALTVLPALKQLMRRS